MPAARRVASSRASPAMIGTPVRPHRSTVDAFCSMTTYVRPCRNSQSAQLRPGTPNPATIACAADTASVFASFATEGAIS